jgi:hypothetical protein
VDVTAPFSPREVSFLRALVDEHVDFLVVGLAAAALQGVPAVTQDVDLWFGDLNGPGFRRALARVGAVYVPPGTTNPPLLVGAGIELFDIVVHMHGLDSFADEAGRALSAVVAGVPILLLPLERIIVSKKATGRPKDLAILPALEDALRVQRRRTAPE